MKKTYECMVLLDNREVKKGWQALKDTVSGMFKKHGAEILSAKRWDERRLMYQVGRCRRGTYLLVYFKNNPLQTNAIRRELELSEQVLRHMMLSCEEVPQSAYEAEAAFDEAALSVEDAPPVAAPAEPMAVEPEAQPKTEAKTEAKPGSEPREEEAVSADGKAGEAKKGVPPAGEKS